MIRALLHVLLALPRLRAHHGLPLRLRHLRDAQVERLTDRHLSLRAFVTTAVLLRLRRAHHELPRRNQHQVQRHALPQIQRQLLGRAEGSSEHTPPGLLQLRNLPQEGRPLRVGFLVQFGELHILRLEFLELALHVGGKALCELPEVLSQEGDPGVFVRQRLLGPLQLALDRFQLKNARGEVVHASR